MALTRPTKSNRVLSKPRKWGSVRVVLTQGVVIWRCATHHPSQCRLPLFAVDIASDPLHSLLPYQHTVQAVQLPEEAVAVRLSQKAPPEFWLSGWQVQAPTTALYVVPSWQPGISHVCAPPEVESLMMIGILMFQRP